MSTDKTSPTDKLPSHRQSKLPPHPRSLASLGKRSRGYSYDNSSDGPCFSSDDLSEACLENYATPRTKKQHRRGWWEPPREPESHMASTSLGPDKPAEKPKDSGIFMASDSSSSNEDGFGLGLLSTRNLKRHGKRLGAFEKIPHQIASKTSYNVDPIAHQIIEACLEADKEDIDLSRCSLNTLSNETLKPLRHLIRRPNVDQHQHHQVEEAFQSFTPQLKIFLASNFLRIMPSEIVNLEYLTVLSLRNNKLTELPQSFGRLKSLVELNVAGNRLTWLPWEIVQLCNGKLQNLHVFPNPLFRPYLLSESPNDPKVGRPTSTFDAFMKKLEARLDQLELLPENEALGERLAWISLEEQLLSTRVKALGRRRRNGGRHDEYVPIDPYDTPKSQPIQLGSTEISLFNQNNTTPRSQAPSQLPRDTTILKMAPSHSNSSLPPESCTRVPSLFELALRTCSNFLIFTHIDMDLPQDTPEHVTRDLELARNASEVGAPCCSVCQKPYILHRAEWIEYWQCTGQQAPLDELWLPFLRRTCSWGCARRVVSERVSRLETDRDLFDQMQIRVQKAKAVLQSG